MFLNGFRSPQNQSWQSVADRINELERQNSTRCANGQNLNQSQKYSYLDPNKTVRVSNITLKAFQKNAVQAYFERQQQVTTPTLNANESVRSSNGIHSTNTSPPRPQSLPVTKTNGSMAAVTTPARTSLPNKLSQIINLTTQLSAEAKKNASLLNVDTQVLPSYQIPPQPINLQSSRIMTIDQSNLQSVNESGIPPPLPRRPSKPRRYVFSIISF